MDAKQGEILFKKQGSCITVEINRPEKNNVLDNTLRKKIVEYLKDYEKDGSIKCVVFRSNGKNFSAGADLNYLLSIDKSTVEEYTNYVRTFLDYIQNYPKVTIGAVQGIAVGGGLELILALDLVVAAEDSRFGQTELNVGLIPGGGGTQRLPRTAGLRMAREMIFTGRLISAQEALDCGIINRAVPETSLMEETMKMAGRISQKSSLSISLAKEAINSQWKPLEDAFSLETRLYSQILLHNDGKEGIKAFLEKRKPSYNE